MIDLRTCNPGDKLISCHGEELIYVKMTDFNPYFHDVAYVDKSKGTGSRTNDGFVFQKARRPEDHNIVKIIRKAK